MSKPINNPSIIIRWTIAIIIPTPLIIPMMMQSPSIPYHPICPPLVICMSMWARHHNSTITSWLMHATMKLIIHRKHCSNPCWLCQLTNYHLTSILMTRNQYNISSNLMSIEMASCLMSIWGRRWSIAFGSVLAWTNPLHLCLPGRDINYCIEPMSSWQSQPDNKRTHWMLVNIMLMNASSWGWCVARCSCGCQVDRPDIYYITSIWANKLCFLSRDHCELTTFTGWKADR